MGAGCSRNSHISDWNTLSEALGYELLYSIVDTKESEYHNLICRKQQFPFSYARFDDEAYQ